MTDNTYTFRHAIEEFIHYQEFDGRITDDHEWSRESIVNKIKEQRSMAIMDAMREKDEISDAMRQILRCVEMEEADVIECPCAPPSGCTWLKSKAPIPVPISISYISDVKGNEDFTPTSWSDAKRIKDSRIPSKRKRRHYLFRENGDGKLFLYVLNDFFSPVFTLSGIFHDPIEVAQFPSCDCEVDERYKCSPMDVPFFTDFNLRDRIFRAVWGVILPVRASSKYDDLNNDHLDRQETIQQRR